MLLSPHSYNVAPIELLFGSIKNANLNPEQLPTAKRYVFTFFMFINFTYLYFSNFKNVVKLVIDKLQSIPKY